MHMFLNSIRSMAMRNQQFCFIIVIFAAVISVQMIKNIEVRSCEPILITAPAMNLAQEQSSGTSSYIRKLIIVIVRI